MKFQTSQRYRVRTGGRLGEVSTMGMEDLSLRKRYLTVETMLVWAAFFVMVACNAAFEVFRLNGTTVAEVSSQVFVWFSPAPYAFFIWGVIYAALVVWLVNFTFDAPERPVGTGFDALLFVVSCILNVAWLVLFHYERLEAALAVIVLLWAILLVEYYLSRRYAASPRAWVPWSIYASWITVAVVVSAANLVTRSAGAGSFLLGEASVVVLSAAVLAVAYGARRLMDDPVYPLVVLWAVVAVGVRLLAVSAMLAGVVFVMTGLAALVFYLPIDWLASHMGGRFIHPAGR